jgi:hypothetical protein
MQYICAFTCSQIILKIALKTLLVHAFKTMLFVQMLSGVYTFEGIEIHVSLIYNKHKANKIPKNIANKKI